MPSQTDFLNDALGQIGAARITSIDDGSIAANYCQTFWPALRRSLLRSHFWNFALKRAQLAVNATPPPFEFAFAYALPTDFLRIKDYFGGVPALPSGLVLLDPGETENVANRYVIEGRNLLTNDGAALIVYVQDVTDPNVWDALFYQGAAAWLASKLANSIPKDPKLAQAKLQEATGLISEATAVDGQEGTEVPFRVDDLTWGR